MTISSTTNRVAYAGNGSTTNFAFAYYFGATSDLLVTVTNDSTGAITTQAITTDYTVSGTVSNSVYASGGTVSMVVAPAAGNTVSIIRVPNKTQGTHWVDGDPDPAATKETAFDKLTTLVQRLFDLAGRSIGLQDGFTTTFSTLLPILAPAQTILTVNDTADGLQLRTALDVGLLIPLRSGVASLSNGATSSTVAFGNTMANANYSVAWSLENTTDSPPSMYAGVVTAKANTGFTVKFSDAMDSANYSLNWRVTSYRA